MDLENKIGENFFRKIVKKTIPYVAAITLGLNMISCPTPLKPDKEIIKEYMEKEDSVERQVIIDSADRILQLQNENGSWDWDVTNQDGPTTNTYLNIAGVTGEVFLDAYNLTKNSKYLDAAKKTGDYLVTEIGVPSETMRHNAFNVVFLYHLNNATGDNNYKDEADAIVNHVLHEDNYWTTHNGNHATDDGIPGCTATELRDALKDYRGAETTPKGIIPYDLFHFIEAAKKAGETEFANNMGDVINNYLNDVNYTEGIDYYELGLATGILGLKDAGLDYNSALEKLLAKQDEDGSWNSSIQDTAYALMATKDKKAAQYLVDNFEYKNGGANYGGWLESDGKEYSEVTSEGGQALAKVHK